MRLTAILRRLRRRWSADKRAADLYQRLTDEYWRWEEIGRRDLMIRASQNMHRIERILHNLPPFGVWR